MPISSSLPGHGWLDTAGRIRWKTEGCGVSLEWEQYEPRAEKPKEIKGKAVISINDRTLQYGNASKTLRWKLQEQEYAVGCDADRCERGALEIHTRAKTKESVRQC